MIKLTSNVRSKVEIIILIPVSRTTDTLQIVSIVTDIIPNVVHCIYMRFHCLSFTSGTHHDFKIDNQLERFIVTTSNRCAHSLRSTFKHANEFYYCSIFDVSGKNAMRCFRFNHLTLMQSPLCLISPRLIVLASSHFINKYTKLTH